MRIAIALIGALASGCGVFGVEVVEREVKASHPPDGIATVMADLSVEDQVSARGGGAAIEATVSVVAWLEPGASAALLDRVTVAMDARGSTLAIDPDLKGGASEQIVLSDLDLVIAPALALDLEVSHGDVTVSDHDGPVRVAAAVGAVSLERTGPVDVAADAVTAEIGNGGRIAATGSGGVTVTVLGSDFESLLVTTDDGPVAIHLPLARGWDIELSPAGEGTASVSLGGLSCGGADQPCDSIRFGEGGPLIRVESGGGTITVDDLL